MATDNILEVIYYSCTFSFEIHENQFFRVSFMDKLINTELVEVEPLPLEECLSVGGDNKIP